MNTLLLCPEIFVSEGGIPRMLRLYLRALCEEAGEAPGNQVSLAALNDPTFPPSALARYGNDRLVGTAACSRSKLRLILAALRLGRQADRIVCGHVRQLFIARLARLFRPRLNYYLVAHGIEVWRKFGPAERSALRGTRRIFCVSDFTRAAMAKNCPELRPEQLAVLPNALDPAFGIAAAPARANAHRLLTVTRLSSADAYKGVDHLIATLPLIRRTLPDASLRVAGTGDDQARLEALAHSHGVGGAVQFLGFVEEARLAEEFEACDLFVLPSEKEGFGLVYLEAMAHGKPCIGARAGGAPEVITDGCGALVNYGDVTGLASACVAALQQKWNVEAILDRARYFSYENFRTRLAALW